MNRREFLKQGAVAVGLAGSVPTLERLEAAGGGILPPAPAVASPAPAGVDNRSADYVRRARGERFLPKAPVARSYPISSMPLAERIKRQLVPKRGLCSIAPGNNVSESLLAGNGTMSIELMGDPYSEQILFHHESLLMPWKRPMEAPKVADIFPQVRQLVMAGRHRDAMTLALQRMNASAIKQNTEPHPVLPAFLMQLELPKSASVKNYLRTLDFENGEIKILWTDERGDGLHQAFVSRPDNVVVQWLRAPAGQSVTVRIALQKSAEWALSTGATWGNHIPRGAVRGVEVADVRQDLSADHLIYKCRLDQAIEKSGYAGVTRIVRTGGAARVDQDALVIENASSVMLLTRIEHFPEFSDDKAESLRQALEQITPDYAILLERHRKVNSEMLNRVTLDFGGKSQTGMSVEELLADQRSRADYSPALLEQIFDMGRHWFILSSGKYPNIPAEANFIPVTGTEPSDLRPVEETRPAGVGLLQMAGAVQGDLRESAAAYFNWIESLAADCRANAANIFGFRGTCYPLWPQQEMGAKYFYSPTGLGAFWPYWISGGGILLHPFWDHYLVTGDLDFLRNRVVPVYKELALFYEDFLTATDKDGNYIFAPSFSPENTPSSTDPAGPLLVNATLDIAVCREVLTNLIQSCQTLGIDANNIPKWNAMLAKLPPCLLEPDGTLKEYAWPTVQERYNHRHVSHLYGAWPGDEIDPDRTPQLAKAALIADRRRTFDVMSTAVAGETLPAYARCHRALAGARLKDSIIVDVQLRQLLEQGYLSATLRCSREPYGAPVPDAQSGLPAIIMEMLAYSRPGVIEVLPALPVSLAKGSVHGLLARTFASINTLAWDMDALTVDLSITSTRKQDITLIARHGIAEIYGPAGVIAAAPPETADCMLRLPEGQRVEIHLKLARSLPPHWANLVVR